MLRDLHKTAEACCMTDKVRCRAKFLVELRDIATVELHIVHCVGHRALLRRLCDSLEVVDLFD
jgi:hypothetical protein